MHNKSLFLPYLEVGIFPDGSINSVFSALEIQGIDSISTSGLHLYALLLIPVKSISYVSQSENVKYNVQTHSLLVSEPPLQFSLILLHLAPSLSLHPVPS